MSEPDLFSWVSRLEHHLHRFTDKWMIAFASSDQLSDTNNSIPMMCNHDTHTVSFRRLARALSKARKATTTENLLGDTLKDCPEGSS